MINLEADGADSQLPALVFQEMQGGSANA